jgi:hypothetical protein
MVSVPLCLVDSKDRRFLRFYYYWHKDNRKTVVDPNKKSNFIWPKIILDLFSRKKLW